MGVRGDREGRIGRDPSADLGEDPDEVDVETVARDERPGDVDVVVGIGIGRVGMERDEDQPADEGEQVQGEGVRTAGAA